jgi:hypothetical protein
VILSIPPLPPAYFMVGESTCAGGKDGAPPFSVVREKPQLSSRVNLIPPTAKTGRRVGRTGGAPCADLSTFEVEVIGCRASPDSSVRRWCCTSSSTPSDHVARSVR